MISFIVYLFITILNFIITFIINLVMAAFPNLGFSAFSSALVSFFGLLNHALNLLYFLCGDSLWIYGDIIIILFSAKHIILPIINFTRKVLIK